MTPTRNVGLLGRMRTAHRTHEARLLLTLALTSLGALAAGSASAQTMLGSMRAGWSTYIFVATGMPRESLVALAREASASGAVLVFRGFALPAGAGPGTAPINLQALQSLVADVDAACCQGKKVAWMVDPKLFDRYRVTAVPSFCVAWGEGGGAQDFSLVSGDMALANALKFMTQQSALPGIRKRAAALYLDSFGGRS
jgi:type-F conjugative transfer system pilin assembly protein TrbC